MTALTWFLASLAVITVTVLAALGLAAILTCVGGTRLRREKPRPACDERDGTSYAPLDHDDATGHDPRWDEEPAPGGGWPTAKESL
ncbi:hypothetical protein [Actinomadura montaniterrae]|uniref:Uncharacterized protein n=1 Tax=Actinomadura montaniterrae TaxID=1803903 RepID=A0A6L3VX67_9ACTN|nr:hypothetical protein [Actinomadura montaniterrae]KAB2384728.1 hypothetical protein F9B16_09785 [Actinomadura montaniterrae]